jgi:uncharacterized membrane protein YdbT with pleckstrin-like domain
MSSTPEQTLLTTHESRLASGLFKAVLLPLLILALGAALVWFEVQFLDLPPYWGVGLSALLLLVWYLSFLGRQRITISNERVLVESGFWHKVRDDVEVFRIRDVVVTRSLWQRILGIGNIMVKATEGRGQPEEVHMLKGVPDPVAVSETIRRAWNDTGRPRSTTNIDG